MSTTNIELFFYVIFALSLGSYSAAFSVRWPTKCFYLWRKEAHHLLSIPFIDSKDSIKAKRSHCSHCSHLLAWFDLLPIVSFLLLKGKCRYCKHSISYRYPIIEALHLILCLPLLWLPLDTYSLILHTTLISALITTTVIDLEHKLIPDECCVIILICALSIHLLNMTLETSVLGILIGYCFAYSLRLFYSTIRKQEGIGLGDVKLISALSAWLGISNLSALLLCASLVGILYTITFNKGGSEQIPFGPFLIFSGIIVFYL
ncbi:hypothetical protein MUS1_10250 [Marinomonas ushuaiensis DSM 15871]|uniref:Prepilin leader peptidase/N-methyltransferase n=1 Tax=Marinomonas ushuaiensis DSM 15871 TaxID=1122207 RepID=X7E8Y8_9GAMM|nr:A24 family peptidase [Marinomonas ushuaiensis]ETX11671.1 hypothetical protein MUS1_10250 [Marinomonas ushuaiensis DSM 15871]